MAQRKRFTKEPGRQIYFDGEPFVSIGREGDTAPFSADHLSRVIARLLNGSREAVRIATQDRGYRARGQ